MKSFFLGLALLATLGMPSLPAQGIPCVVGTGCLDLYAGQTMLVGTVCLSVVEQGTALRVLFDVTGSGCEIQQVHVWVGNNLSLYPKNKSGNPVPGQFPHHGTPAAPSNQVSVLIDLAGIFSCPSASPQTLYILAHASMTCGTASETGWAQGGPCAGPFTLPGSNWATFGCFQLECCQPGMGGTGTETAFAFGGTSLAACFLDLQIPGFNTNRWGWTNGLINPCTPYSWPIYAGAGQCMGGTLVGNLSLSYDPVAMEVTATYHVMPPYTLIDTHLYIGTAILPLGSNGQPTVAPGQYPYTNSPNGTYVIPWTNCLTQAYVIAHAVVGGF